MRANHEIPACSQAMEIFDTYGPHQSSAQLLLRYGFRIEGNDADLVPLSVADIDIEGVKAEQQSELYIDSEGEPSEVLQSLLQSAAQQHGDQEDCAWYHLLLNIVTARLEKLYFHDESVGELLDWQDQYYGQRFRDKAEALGYLISQRLILEGSRAMCLECITDQS